jgi:hypothetical protein
MTIHTPIKEKDILRRKLAADVAEYTASGGVTQAITPEQYRQHNIEREARRDRESAMRDLEQQMDSGYNSWDMIDVSREARYSLLSRTYGDYGNVDGEERYMAGDGPLRSRKELDFFVEWESEEEDGEDDDEPI